MQSEKKYATIHQPDFLPWIGLFNKISKVDHFIILDHTENNPRDSAFWGRRVKLFLDGEGRWFGIPLVKEKERVTVPINEMKISLIDQQRMTEVYNSFTRNYAGAPFFDECKYLVSDYFNHPSEYLSERNNWFILEILEKLHITPQIWYSSKMSHEHKSTALLVELIQQTGSNVYVCGMGAGGYQDNELLNANNIDIQYNNYSPKPYSQFSTSTFVPGLSIIDVLMNLGFAETERRLKNAEI